MTVDAGATRRTASTSVASVTFTFWSNEARSPTTIAVTSLPRLAGARPPRSPFVGRLLNRVDKRSSRRQIAYLVRVRAAASHQRREAGDQPRQRARQVEAAQHHRGVPVQLRRPVPALGQRRLRAGQVAV